MRSSSSLKHALWWSCCVVIAACGDEVSTTGVGLSGGDVTGAETGNDSLSDTGGTTGNSSVDETVGDSGSANTGETGVDPSAGTDDGGPQGNHCASTQDGLCEDLDAVVYCYGGPPGTCGVGQCTDGTQSCDPFDLDIGQWSACSGEVFPEDEVCDEIDNDCDGQVDEDVGSISCGQGVCMHDVDACTDCDPMQGATDEVCDDGLDNDCDGEVDECGCGNGSIDPGEDCDGNDLGGQSCTDLGHDGGTLDCTANCTFDASGCYDCGDGSIDGQEECDGNNLAGQTCQTLGHDGGTLSCSNNCQFNENNCTDCGDGNLDPGEECDGNDLGGATCASEGFSGGTIDCTNNCTLDTSGCYLCAQDPLGYTMVIPSAETPPNGCMPVVANLTCSSDYAGTVDDTNGVGSIDGPYTCGEPYAPLNQPENEDIYSFTCQADGDVQLQISNMNCDLDIYVLDSTCDPDGGCVAGSTNANNTDDSVTFACTAGQTYYIVIEGWGWQPIFPPGGQCGANEGDYILHFATGDLTGGCLEDCDDGVDNDQDGDIDCADSDCLMDPGCMCP